MRYRYQREFYTIDLATATIEQLQEAQERLAEQRDSVRLRIQELKSNRRNFGIMIADDLLKANRAELVIKSQQRKVNGALQKASRRRKAERRKQAVQFERVFVDTAREELPREVFSMLWNKARDKVDWSEPLDEQLPEVQENM